MHLLYSAATALVLLLGAPWWLLQMLRHGKYRAGLGERLGRVPARILPPKDAGRSGCTWVHAVSVGEVLAVGRLVEEMRRRHPARRVVLSTTTSTGQRLARERFGEENVFYFPLDFAFAVRPYFRALAPDLVVMAETEFWPNFLRLARENRARVAVVNARISDRSLPGYRRWRGLLRRVLQNVDLFLAQSEEDARRLAEIGARPERVGVAGNLKFDAASPPASPAVALLRQAMERGGASPAVVCGSTTEGEEAMLLRAFPAVLEQHPAALLVLAPRHPERFPAVAQLLAASGLKSWSRSTLAETDALAGGVLLLDSLGELASIYSLATLALVGGSLVPRGGHNILEPAQHGIPVLVGRHAENFRDIVTLFARADALRVVEPGNLAATFLSLLADPVSRADLGARGLAVFRAHSGATVRTLDALDELMGAAAPPLLRSRRERGAMTVLSALYGGAARARNALYDHRLLRAQRLEGPVVSIGNLSVGGAGKTPFLLLLGSLLQARGVPFDVLSRGYGRSSKGVRVVDPGGLPAEFGDEPLLIARRLQVPVVVGEVRHAAGIVAEEKFGARLHLLDDGFQHRALARDFDIVLVTPEDARDRLLPSGRLREPLAALSRAEAVVLTAGAAPEHFPLDGKLVWRARRGILPHNVPAGPVAFCGIARPQNFFLQLRTAGIEPAAQAVYRDHHAYSERDIRDLLELRARSSAGGFVTTEKDAVNLGGYLASLQPLAVVAVKMEWLDSSAALDAMFAKIAERRGRAS